MHKRSRNFPVATTSMIVRGSIVWQFAAARSMQIDPFSGVWR